MADALCFDLFGTLCDKQVVRDVFGDVLERETGFDAEAIDTLYQDWQDTRSAYTCRTTAMGVPTTYRDVAERSLSYTLDRHDVGLDLGSRAEIIDAHARLEAHEDVPETLSALTDMGFELAVLSNGDGVTLEAIVEHAGIDRYFDRVISAADSGRFKPAPAAYEYAAETLGRPMGNCWLVSAHSWDARGGAQAGMRGAWVNREGVPHDRIGRPATAVASSFAELADVMEKHA